MGHDDWAPFGLGERLKGDVEAGGGVTGVLDAAPEAQTAQPSASVSCRRVSAMLSATQRVIAAVVQVASSAFWAARRSDRLLIRVLLGRRVAAFDMSNVLVTTAVVVKHIGRYRTKKTPTVAYMDDS